MATLLDRLRIARGGRRAQRSIRGWWPSKRVGREPGPSSTCWSRPTSAQRKVKDIRDQLEASTGAHLLIDQVTLAEAGRSVLSETSMAVEKEPLAEMLARP